jgi:hypothetical protein
MMATPGIAGMTIVDTYSLFAGLKAHGFSEEQAKGITEAFKTVDLNGLATKADLEKLAAIHKTDLEKLSAVTKADLEKLAADTKTDLEKLAADTKADLEKLSADTKAELGKFATKSDLEALAASTKADLEKLVLATKLMGRDITIGLSATVIAAVSALGIALRVFGQG